MTKPRSTSRRGASSRAKSASKKKGKEEPIPPKIEPVYTYPLNYLTLKEEERKLNEIVENALPVLPPRRDELEREKQSVLKEPSKVYENEEYFFEDRAAKYLKKNVLEAPVNLLDLEISNGATDFTEDDEDLKREMMKIYKQPKALTLWGVSNGTSNISNRGATSSYFMNDFERFQKADGEAFSRAKSLYFSTTTEGRNSRPNSAQLAKMRPASANEHARKRLVSSYRTVNNNADSTVAASGEKYIEPSLEDETWRTYSDSPTGRTVSSIYNPNTKRPTRIQSFIDKCTITNESLYTYMMTEYVEELDLERCSELSNKILVNIGQFCPSLTSLNLQHCTQIVDSTVRIIVNGCPLLKCINLGLCVLLTDDAVKEIFLHCPDLRILSVHSCEKITGESFFDVKGCENLELLDLSYCTNFSDLALQYVSEYCPKLKNLDLSGCSQISSDGFTAVYRHCTQIETLRLMLCDQESITAECLADITKYAKSMKVLELTGVRQLTNAAVEKIAQFGGSLEFLALNGCVNITDDGLNAVGRNCKHLRVIEVCSCKMVSVQALLDLIHSIKSLSRMVISECRISDSELEILRKFSSRCAILKHGLGATDKVNWFVIYTKRAKKLKKKRVKKK